MTLSKLDDLITRLKQYRTMHCGYPAYICDDISFDDVIDGLEEYLHLLNDLVKYDSITLEKVYSREHELETSTVSATQRKTKDEYHTKKTN